MLSIGVTSLFTSGAQSSMTRLIYICIRTFYMTKTLKGLCKNPLPIFARIEKLSFQFLNGREFHYVKFSKIQNFGKWSKFIPILCIYNLLRSVLPHYAHSIFFLFCRFLGILSCGAAEA